MSLTTRHPKKVVFHLYHDIFLFNKNSLVLNFASRFFARRLVMPLSSSSSQSFDGTKSGARALVLAVLLQFHRIIVVIFLVK